MLKTVLSTITRIPKPAHAQAASRCGRSCSPDPDSLRKQAAAVIGREEERVSTKPLSTRHAYEIQLTEEVCERRRREAAGEFEDETKVTRDERDCMARGVRGVSSPG